MGSFENLTDKISEKSTKIKENRTTNNAHELTELSKNISVESKNSEEPPDKNNAIRKKSNLGTTTISKDCIVKQQPRGSIIDVGNSPLKLKLSCEENGLPLFVLNLRSSTTSSDEQKFDSMNFSKDSSCSNNANFTPAGFVSPCVKSEKNSPGTKFQNISFDAIESKKECPLTSCPSLDSSLSTTSKGTFLALLNPNDVSPSNPNGTITSHISLDSGVVSSFDISRTSSENWTKRRRMASSVSSGTSDLWQSSLDGDFPVPEEKLQTGLSDELVEVTNATNPPWPSFLKKSARNNNLNGCLDVNKCSKSNNKEVNQFFNSNVHLVNEGILLLKEKVGEDTLENIEMFAVKFVNMIIKEALTQSASMNWSIKCSGQCNQESCREEFKKQNFSRAIRQKENLGDKPKFSTLAFSSCSSSLCWTPEVPGFSPSHRSHSRCSKRSSLSFSHDSLVSSSGPTLDDSHLITSAVSHDALNYTNTTTTKGPPVKSKAKKCMDCLNSEIYSLPVDMVNPYNKGPLLHPKVVTHQPKRRSQSRKNFSTDNPKRRNSNSRVKRIHKTASQRDKNNTVNPNVSRIERQTSSPVIKQESSEGKISSEPSSSDKSQDSMDNLDVVETRVKRNSCCTTQPSRFCRILPFSNRTTNKRKDSDVSKSADSNRKKCKSLSTNIRHTLLMLFSFKKNRKEVVGNSVDAKNEFIDASSKNFYESSEGVKWGKICPLPSAPPLRNSVNGSAFTDPVGSSAMTVTTVSNNSPNNNNNAAIQSVQEMKKTAISQITSSHQRQSNSISPASLLSCLGHPRTNSIDYDDRTRTNSANVPGVAVTSTSTPAAAETKSTATVKTRALPPLPLSDIANNEWNSLQMNKTDEGCDFASIIEKVKNYGWYWGPISGEAAEKVLSNEPDGSFIVRDSSDYHYIFSLTFRLNGVTRHVRIEHDQGNFSFGGFTRFKSQTIVDFIEKAVEHSRSGRYLFFLHRRPVLGPMRVQLLHPVSRFKHVQSLQHLCRFVIVKQVRKDLIPNLPLPQRLKDYLSSPHYYSEQVEQCMSSISALTIAENSPKRQNSALASRRARMPEPHRIAETTSNQSSSISTASPNRSSTTTSNLGGAPTSSVKEPPNHLFLRSVLSHDITPPFEFHPNDSHHLMKYDKNGRLCSNNVSFLNSYSLHAPMENGAVGGPTQNSHCFDATEGAVGGGDHKESSFYGLEGAVGGGGLRDFEGRNFCSLRSGSSQSSPSSPTPFNISPPDWLSSSAEDLFCQTRNSHNYKKVSRRRYNPQKNDEKSSRFKQKSDRQFF